MFVVGPLVTTVVVATVGPQYALIVSAACVLAGTLMLLSGLTGHAGPEPSREGRNAYGLGALADPGLRTLVFASLPVGFALGSVEVALPAFADAEGSKALAGVLLAVWSRRERRVRPDLGRPRRRASRCWRRTCASPGCCRVAIAPLALASSPLTMGVLVVLAGLPIAPLIASRNQLVQRVTPAGTATEAYTWPLTALVAGVSLGAAAAGAVVESSSWTTAVLVAAGVATIGAAVVVTRRDTLGQPQPA